MEVDITPRDEDDPGEPIGRRSVDDEYTRDELRKLRARSRAQELFNAERQPQVEPFDAGTLTEVLARPAEPLARVEGLLPWKASALVVAQRKTGKTTLVLNLARCLLTGEAFLGGLAVRPLQRTGAVGMLNFEVSGAQLARWAQDVGVPADRLFLVNVRGRRNPFAHEGDRDKLARLLRAQNVETLIIDPFSRAFPGRDQNATGEVSAWLVDLDRFARAEVGARDLILTTHAGWNGERTRGSSALEDWPDSIITLTKDDSEEGAGARFLRALGRDVDLEEDRLDYDPATRLLTLAGVGNRKQAAATRHLDELIPHVLQIVADQPGITGYKVAGALRSIGVPHQKGDHSKALAQAVEAGQLTVTPGGRGAKCYFPNPTYPDLPPPTPAGHVTTYPDPTLRGGVGDRGTSEVDLPQDDSGPDIGRTCPECGEPVAPGMVRHRQCFLAVIR